LILYNSFSGVIWAVPPEAQEEVLSTLQRGVDGQIKGLSRWLSTAGFLIPQGTDEVALSCNMHRARMERQGILQLILMPTERCNFRCIYCYEDFLRPKMLPEVCQGLEHLVETRAPSLRELDVSWFGGEPLLALDVIRRLSLSFLDTCAKHGVAYKCGITTNGYLLTQAIAEELVMQLKVTEYQITLDGPRAEHDKRRKLIGGGGTFDRIFDNLKAMKRIRSDFRVSIRVNFDLDNYSEIPDFIGMIAEEFRGDKRFYIFFRPVERWGGPNDPHLPVFSAEEGEQRMVELSLIAASRGLKCADAGTLQPEGYVCYAAKPYSIVVGSDGTLYKCTVAFNNERNQVGRIRPDGTLEIDEERFNLWTRDYVAEDNTCRSCSFMPVCHGSACPLIRIEQGRRPCPPPKRHLARALRYTRETRGIERQERGFFGTLVKPGEREEGAMIFAPMS